MRLLTKYPCTGVAFSPFEHGRIAISSAQHFGIVGNGFQSVFDLRPSGAVESRAYMTQDAVYDCCWSESNEHHLVSACGDGSLKLWDLGIAVNRPLRAFHEHRREVYSVNWNVIQRDIFLSASWDGQIKLWTPEMPQSLNSWNGHQGFIYRACWSPKSAFAFLSCSADCSVRMWDTRSPVCAFTFLGHQHEVLSVDWCKYDEYTFASGGADRTIRLWDTRRSNQCMKTMVGHRYAVRNVKFSPFSPQHLLSCSYDLTVALWNCMFNTGSHSLMINSEHHKEFVVALDFNVLHDGQVASASWDRSTCVWSLGQNPDR
uniref:Peroxin-7 n=2 Tax=Guillardia theta TaxID=55529 RepID=A0A7S4PJY4_GUITH|mmetsp:Transcript_5395/g.19018  ORF Transcript_5395/g.19018 Transcript_5395/m.19018 type:complete len:316 (+) Transcript_5395:124-1071(+)